MLDCCHRCDKAHAGLQPESAGSISVPIEEEPWAHHIKRCFRIINNCSAVCTVPQGKSDAVLFSQFFHNMLKERKLLPCVGSVFLPRLIGDREVGINSFCIQPRKPAGSCNMPDAFLRKAPVTQEAETGHPGIHFDVDGKLFSKLLSLCGILLCFRKTGDRLRNVVVDQAPGILPGCVAENQNRHGDPTVPQLKGFIQAGDRQIICPAILEEGCYPQCTVSVGICLHNAKKAASGWNVASDGFIIVFDIAQADFRPGPLLKVIHTFLLYISIRRASNPLQGYLLSSVMITPEDEFAA